MNTHALTCTEAKGRQFPQRKCFVTLTDIRQTGTSRQWDGTTTYSFVATVTKDDPPIVITLTVTPALALQVQAHFDTHHRKEGEALE